MPELLDSIVGLVMELLQFIHWEISICLSLVEKLEVAQEFITTVTAVDLINVIKNLTYTGGQLQHIFFMLGKW